MIVEKLEKHQKESRFIVVEGSIGAGKTSLAKILAEKIQAKLILEQFEENPFLSDLGVVTTNSNLLHLSATAY